MIGDDEQGSHDDELVRLRRRTSVPATTQARAQEDQRAFEVFEEIVIENITRWLTDEYELIKEKSKLMIELEKKVRERERVTRGRGVEEEEKRKSVAGWCGVAEEVAVDEDLEDEELVLLVRGAGLVV
ncbi:uncharacterized protein HKW66_Vig0089990 [Vigna angularis]|uniref:Uncharacterized protein n=1 Tax=Phaseolus angularis TaxID=3914 RepID=A0A8T0KF72_PHAAN|nr:uncharacterized protein HKW66_Vig0089990 [Vigna angularis]